MFEEKEKQKLIKQIINFVNNTKFNQFVEPMRTPFEEERIKQYGYKDDDIITVRRDDQINITFELSSTETINKFLDMIENERFYISSYGSTGYSGDYGSRIELIVRD